MSDPDIDRMRSDAAARASARPRLPFAGTVTDETVEAVPVRWYRPETDARPDAGVVFLHGGYGVLGDLDLQDGYCRRIASILGIEVLSVDYRLAPETGLSASAEDAVTGVIALRNAGVSNVVLWGDSAGGALALVVARQSRAAALVLTNPNVDLTLSGFDTEATGGPGLELSEWAFARWAGDGRLQDSPDLAADVRGLPPSFVAVGSTDSLLQDSHRFVQRCQDAGIRSELHVVAGASHGFMGGPDLETVTDITCLAGTFIGSVTGPVA